MGRMTDAGERMLAAREEIIARLLKSAEMHGLDHAQMVAVSIHAAAAALIEKTGVYKRHVPGSNGEFTCVIPESLGAFDWYGGITFTLKAGTFAQPMSLSTKIYRCGEGPAN